MSVGGEDNTERQKKEKKQESCRVKGVIALRGELELSLSGVEKVRVLRTFITLIITFTKDFIFIYTPF